MGTITYTSDHWDTMFSGQNWKGYRWRKKKDTIIVDQIWNFINNNRNIEYNQLCELIKTFHKYKNAKSSVTIYHTEKKLEIIRKGVFPNIVINKD